MTTVQVALWVVVLLVDHAEFLEVDPQLTKDKVVIDTKGVWK